MEGDSDSLDSDDHGYDNKQKVIIIPITKRNDPTINSRSMQNFILPSPSKQVACDKCSVSLKSIKCLVKHMRDMHSDQETCSYCSECGISKATRKQFQNHQRSHKAAVCPSCSKVLPLWNKHNHVKLYRGQVHEQRFHCDQCGKATKTSHGLEQHMICTYTLYARKFGLIVLKTFHTRNSEVHCPFFRAR